MSVAYELRSLPMPKLTGLALDVFAAVLENRMARTLIRKKMLKDGGFSRLKGLQLLEPASEYPAFPAPAADNADEIAALRELEQVLPSQPSKFPYARIRDYAAAYRNGSTDPVAVAESFFEGLKKSEGGALPLKLFIATRRDDILTMAEASQKRLKAGRPLSLLDGIPIAVKDELAQAGYPRTAGTNFWGMQVCTEDSTVVARLRAAGAMLVGKSNMHELGAHPTGFNAHYGIARNPFNPQRDPGGSSSGSAAVVASGLCPAAIGVDGGGSIRIPAAYCGVVGLMGTFGRISGYGAAGLSRSAAHIGPMASCVEDAALLYAAIAGSDPLAPVTGKQPALFQHPVFEADLRGLKLGIYRPWFEHAQSDIVTCCQELLAQLERQGAAVIDIAIPDLEAMRIAHIAIIFEEMNECRRHFQMERDKTAVLTRINLAVGSFLGRTEYEVAVRLRTTAMRTFAGLFGQVDAIISPATAITAPPIPERAGSKGWIDTSSIVEAMRFAFPPNLTGHPAISFPAGYDRNGMPISLQAIGRPWEESTLLRLAFSAEQHVTRRLPAIHLPTLAGALATADVYKDASMALSET